MFNWDEKTPGVGVLGTQIAKMYPQITGTTQMDWAADAETFFDSIVNGSGRAYLTKGVFAQYLRITNMIDSCFSHTGGLLYYPGDSDDATLNPALNAAMLLQRFADVTSSSDKKLAYRGFAQGQVDYVLGNNPMTGNQMCTEICQ